MTATTMRITWMILANGSGIGSTEAIHARSPNMAIVIISEIINYWFALAPVVVGTVYERMKLATKRIAAPTLRFKVLECTIGSYMITIEASVCSKDFKDAGMLRI